MSSWARIIITFFDLTKSHTKIAKYLIKCLSRVVANSLETLQVTLIMTPHTLLTTNEHCPTNLFTEKVFKSRWWCRIERKNLRELAGGWWLFWRQKTGRMMAVLSCLATVCIQLKWIARKHMQANRSTNSYFFAPIYFLERLSVRPLGLVGMLACPPTAECWSGLLRKRAKTVCMVSVSRQ